MPQKTAYERIEDVLDVREPLAAHEFAGVDMPETVESGSVPNGRLYVGYSEQTLARRLREMAGKGRLTATTREGKNFKEYKRVRAAVPA